MKKLYKVKYDKKAKETRVNYVTHKEPIVFRSTYIKDYMKRYDTCVLSINTNIIDKDVAAGPYIKEVEHTMMAIGAPCEVIPTPNSRDRKLLGVTVGKQKDKAYLLLAHLTTDQFLDNYDKLFKTIDYMVGFGMKCTFEDLVKTFQYEYDAFLVDSDQFEHTLYDSYCIRSLRTTFSDFPEV